MYNDTPLMQVVCIYSCVVVSVSASLHYRLFWLLTSWLSWQEFDVTFFVPVFVFVLFLSHTPRADNDCSILYIIMFWGVQYLIILEPSHDNDKIGWFMPNIYWSRYELDQ